MSSSINASSSPLFFLLFMEQPFLVVLRRHPLLFSFSSRGAAISFLRQGFCDLSPSVLCTLWVHENGFVDPRRPPPAPASVVGPLPWLYSRPVGPCGLGPGSSCG